MQVLYLESLRIRARELPALQFFKETLEAKIGLETERGALTFSVVKHVGLAMIGLPDAGDHRSGSRLEGASWRSSRHRVPVWPASTTVMGTYIVPQIIYRQSSGHVLLPLVPLFRAVALVDASAGLGAGVLALAIRTGRPADTGRADAARRNTSKRSSPPAKKKASSKKATAS